MVFLHYVITIITVFVVGVLGLFLCAGFQNERDNPGFYVFAVIAGIITYGILSVRHKVKAHHRVQRYLSQKEYKRKMNRTKSKSNSSFDSMSTSADKRNMTQMTDLIRVEVNKRKMHITPINVERITGKISIYITTNNIDSAYRLHQIIINTEPKKLNQKLDNFLGK